MKKRLLSIVLLVVAAVLLTLPLSADAACNIYGKITYSANTNTGTNIYVTPVTTSAVTPGFAYYFSIPVAYGNLIGTAHSAQASGKTVLVYGNAASCPGTGITRFGGTAQQINIVNFY